jgi:hypothetical protein
MRERSFACMVLDLQRRVVCVYSGAVEVVRRLAA